MVPQLWPYRGRLFLNIKHLINSVVSLAQLESLSVALPANYNVINRKHCIVGSCSLLPAPHLVLPGGDLVLECGAGGEGVVVWEKEARVMAVGKMLVRLDGKGCKVISVVNTKYLL